jgi:hypothetical protein
MSIKIYLDNCCFNRPFDDQSHIRNRLETEAKLYIQTQILNGKLELTWSYILDFENSQNPFLDRQEEIIKWRDVAQFHLIESEQILLFAESLLELKIRTKDAIHISCSIAGKCNYFLTTDDKLLNKNSQIKEIEIISPVGFIEHLEE